MHDAQVERRFADNAFDIVDNGPRSWPPACARTPTSWPTWSGARSSRRIDAADRLPSSWADSPLFDDTERAVLGYTDAMTRHVQVDDATFARVARAFEAQRLVELTATVAADNMVSRFLEVLQLHSTDRH